MIFKQLKQDAKRLGTQLREAGLAVSHAQTLDMLARSKGHADWNTLVAVLEQRYFYDQHEAILPNAPAVVRTQSLRKACMRDLADIESRTQPDSAPVWVRAFSRAQSQIAQVIAGQLKVDPRLFNALTTTRRATRQEYEAALEALDQASRFSQGHGDTYAQQLSPSETAKRSYHEAYLTYRLGCLVGALRRLEASEEPTFTQLKEQGVNLFTYVGELIATSKPKTKDQEKANRFVAKAALLCYIGSGSVEYGFQEFNAAIPQRHWSRIEELLHDRFPEIALWQAWCELKPLLAPDADDVKL